MADFYEEFKKIESKQQEGWHTLEIAVPRDFLKLFNETISAYQILYDMDKDKRFPAFEAMIIEARNSLPSEVLLSLANG